MRHLLTRYCILSYFLHNNYCHEKRVNIDLAFRLSITIIRFSVYNKYGELILRVSDVRYHTYLFNYAL